MTDEEKKCPFCAEIIKKEAVVCRFCQRDLTDDRDADDEPAQAVKARSGIWDGVKLGRGMFIVLPILLLVGGVVFLVTVGSCARASHGPNYHLTR